MSNGLFEEIQVKGLEQLVQSLKSFTAKEAFRVSRKGLTAGRETLIHTAKRLAPVDSGALRDSIRATISVNAKRESLVIRAGNKEAWYAHLVEYGFMHTSHGKRKVDRKPTSRGFVNGKAFMRNTLAMKADTVVDLFSDAVIDEVAKVISKRSKMLK